MTKEEKIIKSKAGLLELARMLGSVTQTFIIFTVQAILFDPFP